MRLIYNYPFEHDYVTATGRFRPIDLSYSYWPAWHRRPGYVIVTYEALTPDGRPYGPLPGARASDERLGPWTAAHDPGWELVGPVHATAEDGRRARELEGRPRPS